MILTPCPYDPITAEQVVAAEGLQMCGPAANPPPPGSTTARCSTRLLSRRRTTRSTCVVSPSTTKHSTCRIPPLRPLWCNLSYHLFIIKGYCLLTTMCVLPFFRVQTPATPSNVCSSVCKSVKFARGDKSEIEGVAILCGRCGAFNSPGPVTHSTYNKQPFSKWRQKLI